MQRNRTRDSRGIAARFGDGPNRVRAAAWRSIARRSRLVSCRACRSVISRSTRSPSRSPSVGTPGRGRHRAVGRERWRFVRPGRVHHRLYKTEVIRPRGPWRGLEAVEFATLEWVDWFNNRWILEPIGHRPPAEAEAAYYRQTEHTALAA